jgi:hypothetical protein
MFRINLKHSFAIAAVAVGVLAPAGAASGAPVYKGHARLGASVYQHNQTDTEHLTAISDGTSNTIMFGVRAGTKNTKNEVAIETLEVFSGDAYDNEMGITTMWLVPDVDDEVL